MYGVRCAAGGWLYVSDLVDRSSYEFQIYDLRLCCSRTFPLLEACHGGPDPPSPQISKAINAEEAPDPTAGGWLSVSDLIDSSVYEFQIYDLRLHCCSTFPHLVTCHGWLDPPSPQISKAFAIRRGPGSSPE